MAAGSIVVDLLMRTGSFETDTKRAEKRLRELEKSAKQVGAAIGTAFAAAATATAYFVKSSIDAADAAIKNAQAIGLSVEAYTSLAFAADLSGVSQEEMGVSLTKLARQAADAAGGSKTAAAGFDALGISLKNADGSLKATDQLLAEIAEAFAGFADGTAKTALATELFGRSGAKLIPLLNSGAAGIAAMRKEAADLGIVMDTQTAKAAEQFNDDLTRLGAAARGLGNDLMRAALPALQAAATTLLDVARNSRSAKDDIDPLRDMFNALAIDVARSTAQLYIMTVELAGFVAKFNLVRQASQDFFSSGPKEAIETAKRAWAGFNAISEGVKADVDRARAELDRFEQRVRIGGSLTGKRLNAFNHPESTLFGKSPPVESPPTLQGTPGGGPKVSEAARYLENLRKQLQATKDLSVEEALLADIQAGRLGRVTAAQEADLRGVARQIDAAKAMEESQREAMRIAQERSDARKREDEQITESIRLAQEADAARLKALTGGTYSEQLKEVTSDIAFLNRAYEDGKISVELWAEAVTQATGRLQQQAEEVDNFAKTMQENMQTFLGSAFADAMEGNFKNIGRSFTQMINRMVAEALAADLMRRMFGSSAGGSGSGWVGTALGWLGSAFGGAKAGGGDVMPGRSYWVGEQGPERFVPRTAGTILPAAASAGSTGSQRTITLSVNVQAVKDMSRQTALQQGEYIGRGIQRAIARNG